MDVSAVDELAFVPENIDDLFPSECIDGLIERKSALPSLRTSVSWNIRKWAPLLEDMSTFSEYTNSLEHHEGDFDGENHDNDNGIQLSVRMMREYLHKTIMHHKIGVRVPAYVTSVVEYLAVETIENCVRICLMNGLLRLEACHLHQAVSGDDELKRVLGKEVAGEEVMPANASHITSVSPHSRDDSESRHVEAHREGTLDFSAFIPTILNSIDPTVELSQTFVRQLCAWMEDVVDRLMREASLLARYNTWKVVSCREAQTSVRLLFPGELAKASIAQGQLGVRLCDPGFQMHLQPSRHRQP